MRRQGRSSERKSLLYRDQQHRRNPRFAAIVAIDDGDVAVDDLANDTGDRVILGGDDRLPMRVR
jgi:hypothetical protein